ncbi:hypothetical protein [Leucobacter denitrificans]|uniref:Uncharacterized protein n=1 Tax=Leucobacter denitrificans TaxID=683042 RepID=A0A7G9S3C7_9MICO|nr:hypothetical protein [Leucobacter denitrificans]QNN62352.1 hypothetical protein H9L06_08775 [Leucobacter denitrificans]
MSYHGTLERLTDDVQAKVLATFEAWQAGELTQDQFVQLAAAQVAQGNARAVTLADLALATELSVTLGTVQPTVGVVAPDDQDRLRDGLLTLALAAGTVDVTARLARFAFAEPAAAAQRGWNDAMRESGVVIGWVRRLDPGACELCASWARGGYMFPKDLTMIHHPGCRCTPQPITEEEK